MDWTLWTILGVALIPVVLVGIAVTWRDRRTDRHRTGPHEHPGEGEGKAAAWLAHITRGPTDSP